MGYPQYYVTFKTVLKQENNTALTHEVTVDGTHAIDVEARGGTFHISLEHASEADRSPRLVITFSNE